MTLMRLLAGGIGSYSPPAPSVSSPFTLSTAPDGAVNPWETPGAFSYGGFSYLPYVDASGNIEMLVFNETLKHVTAGYVIASGFQADAHTTPTMHRKSDGTFIAIYSLHNGASIFVRTSSDNGATWSGATNLDSQLGGTRYTDTQLQEYAGNLYLFYRDEPSAGTDSRWCISHTSASTPTSGWAAQTIVYRMSGARSYVITDLDDATGKLHFAATSASPFATLGHFYLDIGAGTYHKSDGTTITLPLAFSGITSIYAPAGGSVVLPSNVVIDGSGNPVISVRATISGDIRYIYVWFDGSAWHSTNISSSGTGYEYSGAGTGFGSWGNCIDDGNPLIMYSIEDVSGQPEVFSHTTADGGSTFDSVQITTGSTVPQHNPVCIRNPSTALRCYWDFGSWTDYTHYNVGLKGLGV